MASMVNPYSHSTKRAVLEAKSLNQIHVNRPGQAPAGSEERDKGKLFAATYSTAPAHSGSAASRSASASERANSPFPATASPALSDYCESVVNEYVTGGDTDEDAFAIEREYDDEDEEDLDDDEEDEEQDSEQIDQDEALHVAGYGLGEHEQAVLNDESEGDLSSEPPQERSDGEWDRIEEEIRIMEDSVEGLEHYEIIDKLGEGTFATVYKAIDKNHYLYDNYVWTGKLPGPPPSLPAYRSSRSPKNVYVALKRIYVTSSPQRILNELEIMEDLRDCRNIAFLITAFRTEDQIIAVMPYSRHADFREYYRIMPLMDLKCYFRCLFSALEGAHAVNIIHRDVKPANFLYDPRTGEGTLCDFGLAERFEPEEWRGKCHHTCPTADYPFGRIHVNKSVNSTHIEYGGALHESSKGASSSRAKAMGPPERVGVIREDARQTVRANRAGTRGFRAPEVLYKCQDQTCALDIWSVGIILMAFLTKRFPMFNSNDDTEALLELTIIFGRRRMLQAAILHNRTFSCNLPAEQIDGYRIPDFIVRLNPDILSPPADHPDPQEYHREVQRAMDLCRACLQPDLTKRCTAAEALKHPFLVDHSSSPSDSSSAAVPVAHDTWSV